MAESENFEIFSTMSEEDTLELLEELEVFRALVFASTTARPLPPPIPTQIFAFDKLYHFTRFGPSELAGFFVPGLRSNVVSIREGRRETDPRAVIFHEYVHFVTHQGARSSYPFWYSEGIAEFLSSARRRDEVMIVGGVPRMRVSALRSGRWVPLREIVEATGTESVPSAVDFMVYPEAWALVHYLTLGREPISGQMARELERYLELLRRGEDPVRSFEAAFGEDLDELDDAIRKLLRTGDIRLVGMPLAQLDVPDEAPTSRTPTKAEAAVRLGQLALRVGRLEDAGRYFAKATELDPTNAAALAGLGDYHKFSERLDRAEPLFREAAALAPDEPEILLDLAEFLDARVERAEARSLAIADRDEARRIYRRVLELAPDLPEALAMLGRTYIGDRTTVDQGRSLLERAYDVLPSSPDLSFMVAEAYVAAGDRARAEDVLRRVHSARMGGEAGQAIGQVLDQLEGALEERRARWSQLPERREAPRPGSAKPDDGG